MMSPKLSSILHRFSMLDHVKHVVSNSVAHMPGGPAVNPLAGEGGNASVSPALQNQGQMVDLSLQRTFPGDAVSPQPEPDKPGGAQSRPKTYYKPAAGKAVLRAGEQYARWRNPYISHAMPVILRLQRCLENEGNAQSGMRAQLVLELQVFRERMLKSGCESNLVEDASYLLCTFIDESVNDSARKAQQAPYGGDRSLLVEFHGDAWGGEDAFSRLEFWMKSKRRPSDLLALYELILSLGWEGRYRAIDRGNVLLKDLRSQLHAQIWLHQAPAALGTELFSPPVFRPQWWTTGRAAAALFVGLAVVYILATVDLHSRGRPIGEALAAWSPPLRTIDINETLPPPLPALLAEGWLSAYKRADGWLLAFRSDGAFDVGQAKLRPEFLRNIERFALAFASWPGDLEVIGHTDMQPVKGGLFSSNQALSEARAQTVAEILRQTALPGGSKAPLDTRQRQIEVSGRGDAEPIDSDKTQAAYSRNRRVEVLWRTVPATSGQIDARAWRQNNESTR